MATPNTTFVSGAVLTATQVNNLAWGMIDTKTLATTQSVGTTEVDLTGMSITWTAVANRIYKFSGTINITSTLGSVVNKVFLNDGTSNIKEANLTINPNGFITFVWFVTGITAGSKTYKLRAVTDNNSTQPTYTGTSTSAARASQFMLEDAGAA
jgi:hypothetical protein